MNAPALLIRQMLMASGVKDPEILGTINRVMAAGMRSPSISHVKGGEGVSVPVPEGSSCVRASMESPTERIEVLMLVHPN